MAAIVDSHARRVTSTHVMPQRSTVPPWLLSAAALGLIAFMIYALLLGSDVLRFGTHGRETIDAAVFYPDLSSWRAVVAAAEAAQARGLVQVVQVQPESVSLRLPRTGRTLKLDWIPNRGTVETRTALESLLARPNPPRAIIGSSNTALTLALASALATRGTAKTSPVLLLPDASAVAVNSGSDAGLLLSQFPGRTFRVGLDNAHLANLLVQAQTTPERSPPSSVVIVIDPRDPCSIDFANHFERVLRTRFPAAEVARDELNSETDISQLAHQLVRDAANNRSAGMPWIVLTLQGDPARRVLLALQQASPGAPPASFWVLCGDGLGLQSLEQLQPRLRYPVSCASSLSPRTSSLSNGRANFASQLHTEGIGALAGVLDQPSLPEDLAAALEGRTVTENAARRPIAFRDGERDGVGLGSVLELLPTSSRIKARAPDASGRIITYTFIDDEWTRDEPSAGATSSAELSAGP